MFVPILNKEREKQEGRRWSIWSDLKTTLKSKRKGRTSLAVIKTEDCRFTEWKERTIIYDINIFRKIKFKTEK